jgi:hypothetical protein
MINYKQFRENIVVPVLKYLEPEILYSESAANLLMMTAAHESKGGTYLKQLKGPALGVYQMEPSTQTDTYANFLRYRDDLNDKVMDLLGDAARVIHPLVHNLAYATAMARVHYYRVPEALPDAEDTLGLAKYAKAYYNTNLGKAKVEDYKNAFEYWRDQ